MKKPYLFVLYFLNLAIIIFFWAHNSWSLLSTGGVAAQLALARLAGLTGAFSILAQYTLISTAPWVNRRVGQYKLKDWHMLNGKLAYTLIATHILLIYSVYDGPLKLPYVWLAGVAFIILTATVGAAMFRKILPEKIWRNVHRFNYGISALIIWHQLANGGDLLTNRTFRLYWIVLNVFALANLVYFRLIKPRLPQPETIAQS